MKRFVSLNNTDAYLPRHTCNTFFPHLQNSPNNLSSLSNAPGTPRDDGDLGGNFLHTFQNENVSIARERPSIDHLSSYARRYYTNILRNITRFWLFLFLSSVFPNDDHERVICTRASAAATNDTLDDTPRHTCTPPESDFSLTAARRPPEIRSRTSSVITVSTTRSSHRQLLFSPLVFLPSVFSPLYHYSHHRLWESQKI